MRFESTEAKEGVFQPQLFYGDQCVANACSHLGLLSHAVFRPRLQLVTPFAMAAFSRMGKLGNFGVEKRFPSGTITIDELDKAEFEVAWLLACSQPDLTVLVLRS